MTSPHCPPKVPTMGEEIRRRVRRPGSDGAAPDKDGERQERLARALRENLRRRKAQARARGAAPAGKGTAET